MLRREADENEKTMVATMYQAGHGIYNEFDKILVLADGRVTYYGPRELAQAYFEDLGFVTPKGANIADFLTSVTVVTERIIKPGMEKNVPNTPEDFETRFQENCMYKDMMKSIELPEKLASEEEMLKLAVTQEKRKKHLPRPRSPYTANLWEQILSCTIRWVLTTEERGILS